MVSVVHVATGRHGDVHGLCCHLRLCCLGSLQTPEAVLISMIHAAPGDHFDVWSLVPLGDMLMSVIFAYNPEFMVHVLWWASGCNPAFMEHELWRFMLITHTLTLFQRG